MYYEYRGSSDERQYKVKGDIESDNKRLRSSEERKDKINLEKESDDKSSKSWKESQYEYKFYPDIESVDTSTRSSEEKQDRGIEEKESDDKSRSRKERKDTFYKEKKSHDKDRKTLEERQYIFNEEKDSDIFNEEKNSDEQSRKSSEEKLDKFNKGKGSENKRKRSSEDKQDKHGTKESDDTSMRSSEESEVKIFPKVFELSITAEEFDRIRPLRKSGKEHKKLQFVKGWTHVLAEKFSEVNPACILKFKYHKVQEKSKDPRRSRCYFISKAECKHENCGKWTMKIDKEPERGSRVIITVLQTKSVQKHKSGCLYKRQLTSTLRRKAQSRLQKESVDSIYWSEYKKMPEAELKAENFTKCQSETVLRKAKSEISKGDMLHPEPFTELVILKDVFDADESYIQEISFIPFMTVLFSENSVNIAKNVIRNGSGVFYFGKTGQVVKMLHQKRVFYYCMIINEKGMPVVPVLEYLSDHHATNHIIRPLLSFRAALGPKMLPRRIEVDFSWAIIHSVLLTFNSMSIHEYLQKCYQVCMEKEDCRFMIVHICCVHILRAVRVTVKEKLKDHKMRELILRMVALLQNTTNIQQAVSVWKTFCTVLTNRKKTKTIDKAVEKMNKMLKDASLQSVDTFEDNICIEDEGDSGLIGKDKNEKLGIRERSPFRPLFIQYLVEDDVEDNLEIEDNIYFQADMITHIGQNYMPLYPMWSGCLLTGEKTRDSNASVEAWMKIVKKDVLMGKKI